MIQGGSFRKPGKESQMSLSRCYDRAQCLRMNGDDDNHIENRIWSDHRK